MLLYEVTGFECQSGSENHPDRLSFVQVQLLY